MGSVPFICGLSPLLSRAEEFVLPFFDDNAFPFDEVVRVGTGLSLEVEL